MHPEFGPIAIIAATSLLLPLPWHWRAGNVATLSIIGWLFLSNVIFAVDALIWSDNINIVIPVWCDITTKLIIGANFALPAACLCVCIHLEQVASVRLARTSISDKRRRQLFEAGMCIGLPIIFMALHYVVQGHRFDIIEGYGCRPTTYFSIPAIFIVWIPPILLSIAAIVYAGLALRHFMARRLTFAAHLDASSSALTTSRYLRLMTMAALQMVWSITVTSYALWFTVIAVPIRPWTTWSDVHSDWLRVDLYPDAFTPDQVKRSFYVLWWLVPISTFLFIAFFAFGKDAIDEYKKCFLWIRVKALGQQAETKSSKELLGNIPMSPRSKSSHGIHISKTIITSNTSDSTLPPYSSSGSSFTTIKKSPDLTDYDDSETHSEPTHYGASLYGEAKAVGSYSDLSLRTPSTAGPFTPGFFQLPDAVPEMPLRPPSPLTPPPQNPRLRAFILTSSSSPPLRPLTYPSFDMTPRGVQHP
ncbi:hypothetical protein GALMADRAFT_118997 [Galerina marginata CBS 339.88]|uniref:Uncharacterized protein n=1 Tax=Galerina marginata (strain CBS 339.88) TaxID=685588 RepID=A0A067TDX3_GALM3|nr:hypothetical protein GALMADRAFT_118997 [Galerina marginata CBS 339.88]